MTDTFRRRRPLSVPDFIRFYSFRFSFSSFDMAVCPFFFFFLAMWRVIYSKALIFYITLSYYTLHYSGFGTIGK